MKGNYSLKLFMLLSVVAGQALLANYSSYDSCGPLDPGSWYVMPKVGVAPGLFSNRGHERRVVPHSGIECPINVVTSGATTFDIPCSTILPTPEDVFQENCCRLPKFSTLFTNGVLHVGGEIGYTTDAHCQYFIDLVYNRARGSCLKTETKNVRAPNGCGDCNDSCNNTDCSNPLTTSERTDSYGNYTAFGAYAGNRHYFNRMWCDRLSIFLGLKVGILHRKEVCVTSVIPAVANVFDEITVNNVVICKSNAVSGGVQIGFDYCINDCLAFLVGVEVVASCPFNTNDNIPLAYPTTLNQVDAKVLAWPTNVIPGSSGVFVQFPVWAGLRWEWDMCCERSCN